MGEWLYESQVELRNNKYQVGNNECDYDSDNRCASKTEDKSTGHVCIDL